LLSTADDDDDDESKGYVRPLLQVETVTSVLVIQQYSQCKFYMCVTCSVA